MKIPDVWPAILGAALGLLLFVLMSAGLGFLSLWAINTLFAFGLAYSLKNIAAATVLAIVVGGSSGSSKS